MRARLLHEAGGQRTFSIVLETDDEVLACLTEFAQRERLNASQFTAIGAFRRAVLGYFEWERKDYRRNPIEEQVEVASLVGDVAQGQGGAPALHIHAVLGRRDGTAVAGHLLEGYVRPTLEVVLTESPAHLRKRHDSESGLALIDPLC
ncbi:MAG TPA: PPC domain-containing DNA-binding protein [Roseiarcus sp.]|jgi:hypothetical protein|nr:PPC domain-containing DNA-binding protein [Roseiarcus sp.]